MLMSQPLLRQQSLLRQQGVSRQQGMPCQSLSRQQGVSMIEVLVALLILSIGVLGFAALQLRSLQLSQDGYEQSQSMAIARDLAGRIQANRGKAADYATALTAATASTVPAASPTTCQTGTCDATQLKDYDAQQIRYMAGTMLSGGQLAVEDLGTAAGTRRLRILASWGSTTPTQGSVAPNCYKANGDGTGQYVNKASCLALEMVVQ